MEVLCIGHASWDISVFVPGYPAENSKSEVSLMIECGGGPAANAAYLLSRWGVNCGLAAAVGDDGYGERILRELEAAGTDVSLVEVRRGTATPVSVILVNETTGSRTIVNRKVTGGNPLELHDSLEGAEPAVLLFDGHELEAALKAMGKFPRARTILDAGSVRPGTLELAGRVDYLVCSERFALQFTGLTDLATAERQGAAVAALHRCNGHPVVITRGEHGLLHGTAESWEALPACPVKAVDTTAAGDFFHGALAYAILRNHPWHAALALASRTAAQTTTTPGTRPAIGDGPEHLPFFL
jgi:sulfofructose kinase